MGYMTNFAKQLQTHLAGYKQERLRITEDGIWARNGKAYPHVLPAADKEYNILEPIRTAFWDYAGKNRLRSQLHRDFHHLSSSQALTFNLFFTFFGLPWSEHAVLLEALGVPGQPIASFEFESVPDQAEATSFDFCATFTNGTRLLVEVKLSESDFGKCKNDEKHQIKRDALYRSRLVGKVQPSAVDSGEFFTQYQLLHNVSHLREGDALVFLLPRANRAAFAHAKRFVKDVVTDATRPAIHVVAIEELLDAMSSAPVSPQTSDIITMLREKYIVAPAA